MTAARRVRNLVNPFSDSEPEDDAGPVRWSADHVAAVIEITMGGFKVTCLNSKRKMALKLDDVTVSFISSWVVPFVKVCAGCQELRQESLASASVEDQSQGYRQAASKTPNLRDKVVWNPTAHTWKLIFKNQKGHPSEKML